MVNTASVAASCHLPLHVCNRSLFAHGLFIDYRAYVISQHERWPIRTPEWSSANFIHTAAWHAGTRTPPRNAVQKAVFSLTHFPPHLSVFGHRAILIWGERGMAEGFLSENRPIPSHLKRPHGSEPPPRLTSAETPTV